MITTKQLFDSTKHINDNILEKEGKGQIFLYHYPHAKNKEVKRQISVYINSNGKNDFDGVDHDRYNFTTKSEVKSFLRGFYSFYKNFSF